MVRARLRLALACAVSLAAMASASAFEQRRCRCAADLAALGKHLPELAMRVSEGRAVTIVAIGSSSTEGTPSLRRGAVYPAVLERMLAARWPVPVRVINRGRGGEAMPETIARFDRDVFAHAPDLVVWQLGVNDVLSEDGVSSRAAMMQQALARFDAARIPVVLVDLQYAPRVTGDPDTPVMQAAIRSAASLRNVAVFTRFAIMKRIVEAGEASLPELIENDGLHMSELGHGCTGALLAEGIARASLGNPDVIARN